MRVLLYDPYAEGHHEVYLQLVAQSLGSYADVLAVVSEDADLGEFHGEVVNRVNRDIAGDRRASVAALRRAVGRFHPDAAFHLFADRDLPILALERGFGVPTSLLMFRPRRHYPKAFGSSLTPRESAKGVAIENFVRLWLRKKSAFRLLTLDEYAASRWQSRYGPKTAWWPEPPPKLVTATPSNSQARKGIVLFGSIAPRKGVEALCHALEFTEGIHHVTFAGHISSDFMPAFSEAVQKLDRLGIVAKIEDRWLSDAEVVDLLAGAEISVVPYPRHFGMSRVLLESAAAGTPVVGNEFGLIGKLIVDNGLGLAVDTNDPMKFATALDFAVACGATSYVDRQRSFVARFSEEAFDATVRSAVPIAV